MAVNLFTRMSYDSANPFVVADASPEVRAGFYRRTYLHVAGAFAAWAALLAVFFLTPVAGGIASMFFGMGNLGMMLVMLGLCFAVNFSQSLAFTGESKGTQYAGFGLAVLLEAVLFVPLIFVVVLKTGGGGTGAEAFAESLKSVFAPALLTTGLLIAGLTASVFMTKTDFSFLRTAIVVGSFVALGVIICAMIFGISLGFFFSMAMVVLMAAAILYQTWQIKDQARPDQHVGAACALFVSFVTLLWYVIQLFASRRD